MKVISGRVASPRQTAVVPVMVAEMSGFTVRVAGSEVVELPHRLDTTTRYWVPLSLIGGAVRLSVAVVALALPAAGISVNAPAPTFFCHWYVRPVPWATTVKLALPPTVMVWFCGWPAASMTGAGAGLTVTVKELVASGAFPFDTVTSTVV